jgi:glycosyltransferase involved in cell wall biosynthesis
MRSISAIMVTGLDRGIEGLPRMAVDCFLSQTYPHKELVIINHGTENFSGENVRDIKVHKDPEVHVGGLRNIAFSLARGDYLMTWDDDDWQSPDRMEYQSARTGDGQFSILRRRTELYWDTDECLQVDRPTGFGASILHPKDTTERYENWRNSSDVWFKCMFLDRVFIDNPPEMYVYNLHGRNLTEPGFAMSLGIHSEPDPRCLDSVSRMKQALFARQTPIAEQIKTK